MKKLMFCLVMILVIGVAGVPVRADTNSADSSVTFNPVTNNSSIGVGNMQTPNLTNPQTLFVQKQLKAFGEEGWQTQTLLGKTEIPVSVLQGQGRSRGITFWKEPFKKCILFAQGGNEKPIRIYAEGENPPSTRILGSITIQDRFDYSLEQVKRQALYHAKKLTGTCHVSLLVQQFAVPTSNTKGIGGSSVKAKIGSDYDESLTAGGNGLWSKSESWINHGTRVRVICYEAPMVSLDMTGVDDGAKVAREIAEEWFEGRVVYFMSTAPSREEAISRIEKSLDKVGPYLDEKIAGQIRLLPEIHSQNKDLVVLANPGQLTMD